MIDPNKRYALVTGARSEREVAAYLPDNYSVIAGQGAEADIEYFDGSYLIEGEDNAGWTLDEYVIPRLASGLMGCKEQFVWLEDDGDGESGPHLISWLEDEPQTAEAMARRNEEGRSYIYRGIE